MSTSARTSALRAVPASPLAGTQHRPLPIPAVRLVGGPLTAWQQRNDAADGLYGPDTATELGDERTVTAIPLSTWGNRAPGPMRVWPPRAPRWGLQ
ncbi:hypothetical protein [Catellatospora chokoriensis]|uniref:Non-reducing end beta-L-arabinofuranosidase-like GH127 C-terminal domain-containing protein n=1 Tax=Catellatospora chokoriensis TaxID=310353 RepID=A0A8J3K0Q5_9ACTN|nr:hypothetical protein [Catellatospora chokoriensis]GIF90337.1 hypothetical protein Cch02nite_37810 [Catellatospora chokoriensis]